MSVWVDQFDDTVSAMCETQIEQYLASQQAEHALSGCVSVTCGVDVNVFSQPFGLADREAKAPITSKTRFRIASVTKQFTAYAVLKTIENLGSSFRGLETKLVEFYPGFGGKLRGRGDNFRGADEINMQHLLQHTSGLVNYSSLPAFGEWMQSDIGLDDLIGELYDEPLAFEPGERFQYGNTGYLLLGRILEKLHGKPLDAVYRELIFEPAGMTDTGLDVAAVMPEGHARGYQLVDGAIQDVGEMNIRTFYAAGGLYSTIEDLDRWCKQFYSDGFLSAGIREQLYGNIIETGSHYRSSFGLVSETRNGRDIYYIGGGIPGFSSICMYSPADEVGVNVLSNFTYHQLDPLAFGLIEVVGEELKR